MPHDAYRALYIHIPFCKSRCAYCDFTTQAADGASAAVREYFEGLIARIRQLARDGELATIETVYIGGGTPTHAGSANLTSLLYALGVSMHLTSEVECTVEANPESLDARLVDDLWALGANRLSIGVQSFDDALLAQMGRAHDAEQARAAVRTAQRKFANISIDLMCGLPGQTVQGFEADVREAVALGAAHASIYPLTVEEGTPFANMVRAGEVAEPDDDAQADMMEAAERILCEAGFARYEVASYARPGFESRHNSAYWHGVPYLGIGTSATTMTQNAQRRMRVQDGQVVDDLDAAQMAAEDLMLAMRTAAGVPDSMLERASGLLPDAPAAFARLSEAGLAEHERGAWRPTRCGWLCGNELYGALLELSGS